MFSSILDSELPPESDSESDDSLELDSDDESDICLFFSSSSIFFPLPGLSSTFAGLFPLGFRGGETLGVLGTFRLTGLGGVFCLTGESFLSLELFQPFTLPSLFSFLFCLGCSAFSSFDKLFRYLPSFSKLSERS